MINTQLYKGIAREKYPEWFGWFIIDLLKANPNESEEHKAEIKIQLDFEVKIFKSEIVLTLPADTGF